MDDEKTTRDGAARPLRLLVVEDSPRDAELIVRELQRRGYAVTWRRVETEAEMKAALDAEPWEAVVSDYRMPHFDGLAALRVLQEKGLDIPFILVSGTIGEELAVAAMKGGAHDYLMKDKLARLAPAIERELAQAFVRRERKRADKELRQSEERSRILFEQAADIILLLEITPEGNPVIREANSATLRLLGFKRDELIGQPVSIIEAAPDAYKVVDERRRNVLSGIGTIFKARRR
jgi:CheY-like chemotaxis protein